MSQISTHHTLAAQQHIMNVINPATEQVIAQLPCCSLEQVNQVIADATQAFKTWQYTNDASINEIFLKISHDLRQAQAEIALMITQEQGKPLALAQFEVEAGAAWIEYLTTLTIPTTIVEEPSGKTVRVYHRAVGVVASITPWNWPFMIAVWHLFPALKARNCVVNKPSEYTPLSTLKLVEIMNRHLPEHVCQVVLGRGEVGQALSSHPDIAKVTFTGSTATGQSVLRASVDTLKSVVLELGGNDVAIVLDNAQLEQAVQGVFASAFLNAGQTCAAIKRLYVHERIYDEFVEKFVDLIKQQVIGDGTRPDVTFGPVQNKAQYDKVNAFLQDAIAQGGQVLTAQVDLPEQGYFIAPTLIAGLSEDVALVCDEQFGPVLPILKFKDVDDVLERTNQSQFGLGGSVWSEDLAYAEQIASRMQTGTVWINSHSDLSPAVPFGGWKMSGSGYSFGLDGLLLFTQKQAVHITSV